MENKKTVQYVLIGVALIVALLGSYFGVKLPAPVIPDPVVQEPQLLQPAAALLGNEFESLIVTKQLSSKGVVLDNFVFEGSVADAYETTLAITNPTADRTITVPNSSGTIALNPAAGSWEFEGTTADAFETTLSVTDPTADNTVTIPNETAAVMVSSLTTNATDAANAVTGASNSLIFEGATANGFETSLTPADPTADVTLTLPNETGTVALTSQAVDMTLEEDSTGGNAGAKTEFVGLPRIKLVGAAAGTNPASQSISLADDSPEGEFAPVDASVTEAAEAAIYKFGAGSYKATWAADAAENDGFVDAGLFGGASLEDQESLGLWLYTNTALASGDLQIVITDDGGARKFNIGAVATVNKWTWVEIDISSLAAGTGDSCTDFAITMTAQGAAAATLDSGFITYFDNGWVWDAQDEESLGVDIVQDGVLSVIDVAGGTALVEGTDYFVHYQSTDAIVYVTDQSANEIVILVAY